MNRLLTYASVLATTAVLILPTVTVAEPIKPGFDLLNTKNGEISVNGLTIKLKGIPFFRNPFKKDDSKFAIPGLGDTNTIFERRKGVKNEGEIPIEIVALSLRSIKPVKVDGKGFFDVFVTLNTKNNKKSEGRIAIKAHDDGNNNVLNVTSTQKKEDGQFQIPFLNVFLQVDFIPIGGNTANLIRETVETGLMSTGGSWSHGASKGYPTIPNLPAGNFFFNPFGITDGVFALSALVPASVSEPLTLALLGTGLVLVGVGRRRRCG